MNNKISDKIIEITSLIKDRHTLKAKQGLIDLRALIEKEHDDILKAFKNVAELKVFDELAELKEQINKIINGEE